MIEISAEYLIIYSEEYPKAALKKFESKESRHRRLGGVGPADWLQASWTGGFGRCYHPPFGVYVKSPDIREQKY